MPALKLVGSAIRLAAGEAQRRLKESDKKKRKRLARKTEGKAFGFNGKPKPKKPDTRGPKKRLEDALLSISKIK